jgi:hypothetical protein
MGGDRDLEPLQEVVQFRLCASTEPMPTCSWPVSKNRVPVLVVKILVREARHKIRHKAIPDLAQHLHLLGGCFILLA